MMASASCKHVSRNELTAGGIVAAISAIRLSGIGPGPLGIADTNPIADAPASIAIHASSTLAIQQIFTRGFGVGLIAWLQRITWRGDFEQPRCIIGSVTRIFSRGLPRNQSEQLYKEITPISFRTKVRVCFSRRRRR